MSKEVHAIFGIFKGRADKVKKTLSENGITYWVCPSNKMYWNDRAKAKEKYDEEIGIEHEHTMSLEVRYPIYKETGVDEAGFAKPKEKLIIVKTLAEYLRSCGKKIGPGYKEERS